MKNLILLLFIGVTFPASAQKEYSNTEIEKVHLIFKTHLDVGFTDLGSNVLNTYMTEFIPAALNLSDQILSENSADKYPWTTGSWLLWNYMQKASESNRTRMKKAIERNDFFWHALPFTVQAELCDSSLFSAGFLISKQLDQQFGKKTISAKMTDVPGITRSAIPVFEKQGIKLLHIGTNPCVPRPDVPTLFRWKNTDGSEILVIYQIGYGEGMKIPGAPIAAIINFTNDNHGPHTRKQINEVYRQAKKQYPNAQIIASSLDNITEDILSNCQSLPIITQEIGDSWIWGVVSDPKKVAEMRELMRLRNQWLISGKIERGSDLDFRFSLPLLMVSEHTWGLDVKSSLNNWDKYTPAEFEKLAKLPAYSRMEQSWREKQGFIYEAIAQLPQSLQREATFALNALTPEKEDTKDYQEISLKKPIKIGDYEIGIDEKTGALFSIRNTKSGRHLEDSTHTLGQVAYQTFSEDVFKNFIGQYCPPNPPDWALMDYGKRGLASSGTKHETFVYEIQKAYKNKNALLLTLALATQNNSEQIFGAPKEVTLKYSFNKKGEIDIEMNWFGKNKTRIPEALWFSFTPQLASSSILAEKMNMPVDITDVIKNGSRNLHAITDYLLFKNKDDSYQIQSFDAPLVAFNKRDIMYFDNIAADPDKGAHFCLYNNCWGTNYPQWCGYDMKYRFKIYL